MISLGRSCSAVVILSLLAPFVALADISQTATLAANSSLNFDTGAKGVSGGDIFWNGSSIAFQGSAKGEVIPGITGSAYALVDKAALQAYATDFTITAISSGALSVGTILGVRTNGGNLTKAMVTSISAGSITLQFATFSTITSTAPTVTGIQNNYSFIPQGFPNYGIAPGTLFIIKGFSLTSETNPVLQSSAAPGIPLLLNGASVSVTVNGTTVQPGLYYAIATQIAAVLPSNTPTGTGTLTVSYNGATSAAFPIVVVPSAFGFGTYLGSGSGLILATEPTSGALFTYTNSAAPGQTIVLWGSGLGADTADSDTVFTSSPHAVATPLKIFFGGVEGKILYQGSSGFPGLTQINVTIPAVVPTGCNVSVSGLSGAASNSVTIPINVGGGTCSDTSLGSTGGVLGPLSKQPTIKTGVVFVSQSTSPGTNGNVVSNAAGALFNSYPSSSFAAAIGSISLGGCTVTQFTGTGGGSVTGLDAGLINLTFPTGSALLTDAIVGNYFANLPTGAIQSGAGFSFKGNGGGSVGTFSAVVSFPSSVLSWTNQAQAVTVNRAQGLGVTWSGGAQGSYVIISGTSGALVDGQVVSGSYACYASASALSFTVPSYILSALPAGTGSTTVRNVTNLTPFTAAGLDFGVGIGSVSFQVNSAYN
jgi:uncharacterized protein (TIGR03437 family)